MRSLPHLLHVFSTFDPGGPEVRTAKLIEATEDCFLHWILAMDGKYGALARINNRAHVEVLPPPPIVPEAMGRIPPVIRPPAVAWRLVRNAAWLRKQIRAVQPNLMLTYNLGAASALLAARTIDSCPIIHTETGFSAEESVRLKPGRVLIRRLVVGNVSALIVPSRALEQIAKSAFRLRVPIIRITNGVDVRKFKPANRIAARIRLGFDQGEILIGCVGHLRAEKGQLRLLRAFREAGVPNSRLLFLGDGPMRSELEKTALEMGIGSQVILAGSIEDVTAYYAAMDIFALASDTEQMPMALLEAMACGLPGVSTDVGDCREMLGPQLVPSVFALDDIAGFAEALRVFSGDKDLRVETGERNRRRCVEEYDSEQMLARYRELYIRSISGTGTRPS